MDQQDNIKQEMDSNIEYYEDCTKIIKEEVPVAVMFVVKSLHLEEVL